MWGLSDMMSISTVDAVNYYLLPLHKAEMFLLNGIYMDPLLK